MVLVDGGDCLFASPTKKAPTRMEEISDLATARKILLAYNLMGYQALGIGPADLQLGRQTLEQLQKESRFPFLCANVVDKATRKPVFQPYVVIEALGIKLGIYSVLMKDLNDTFVRRVLPDAEILDPEQTTREVVKELRGKSDVVIGLSHLNVGDNEKILAARVGIDALLDPFSRNGAKAVWIDDGAYCATREGTAVLRIDGQGSRVGVFEMFFSAKATKMAAYRGYDVPLEPHVLRHPEMTARLAQLKTSDAATLAADVDTTRPRLVQDFLGEEGCGACHEEQLQFWKATKHATAFATLEKGGEQDQPECFVCHTYGYGVTFADPKAPAKFRNVQCESCHGMKAGHAENPRTDRLGTVGEDTCWGCHNPTITEKNFDPAATRARVSCPKIKR